MTSMIEVARAHTGLDDSDRGWLTLLLADWQILADLSFADLVLWLPDQSGEGWWAAAQMRPTTGPTAIVDDIVGTRAAHRRELAEAIPVVNGAGRQIAVIERRASTQGGRTRSRLERAYLDTAAKLTSMIASGDFPHATQRGDHADSPRVGDGFIRIDEEGAVSYASPNAQSVYRKLGLTGDLTGHVLATTTRELVPASLRQDEETISAVLGGRVPRDTELGNAAATLVVRAIPLSEGGQHRGALVLLRDVTELRRRDRELVTKDATIREIHHRVKNNLQTVAALLRLQSRRIDSESGRFALDEAVRRVGAIAVVHEMLSQSPEESVDFDEIADQLARLVLDVGQHGEPVSIRRQGSFGMLASEVSTPVAMVLTELLQNAVEHGIPSDRAGDVLITCARSERELSIGVDDDGNGWPDGFTLARTGSLGLSIVQTLIGELGGTLTVGESPHGGAQVRLTLPLPSGGADA